MAVRAIEVDDWRDRLQELFMRGLNDCEIVRELGGVVTPGTVNYHRKRLGFAAKRPGRPRDDVLVLEDDGAALRAIRGEHGLSMRQLERRASVAHSTVRRLETFRGAGVRADVLERIAGALGVTRDGLQAVPAKRYERAEPERQREPMSDSERAASILLFFASAEGVEVRTETSRRQSAFYASPERRAQLSQRTSRFFAIAENRVRWSALMHRFYESAAGETKRAHAADVMRSGWSSGTGAACAVIGRMSPRVRQIWHGRWGGTKGGRPRSYTDEQAREVIELRKRNPKLGGRTLAERVGLSHYQVREILAAQSAS
jgi:transcriptional regulator with XRE-family HTH domain